MSNSELFDKVNAKGKRYYEKEDEAGRLMVFEDGTIYNMDAKRLVCGPKNKRITTANTKKFHELKRRKGEERVREFVLREIAAISPDTDLKEFEDAWGAMAGRLAGDAFMSDATLKSRVDAFKAVGLAAGELKKDQSTSLQLSQDGKSMRVDGLPEGDLLMLLSKLGGDNSTYRSLEPSNKEAEAQTIDAEYRDNSSSSEDPDAG